MKYRNSVKQAEREGDVHGEIGEKLIALCSVVQKTLSVVWWLGFACEYVTACFVHVCLSVRPSVVVVFFKNVEPIFIRTVDVFYSLDKLRKKKKSESWPDLSPITAQISF